MNDKQKKFIADLTLINKTNLGGNTTLISQLVAKHSLTDAEAKAAVNEFNSNYASTGTSSTGQTGLDKVIGIGSNVTGGLLDDLVGNLTGPKPMPPASNGSDLNAIQKEEEDNTTTYLIIGVGVLLVAGVWYAKKKGLLK
jgi:hypothetical protein